MSKGRRFNPRGGKAAQPTIPVNFLLGGREAEGQVVQRIAPGSRHHAAASLALRCGLDSMRVTF
jgi:hypothetical protein